MHGKNSFKQSKGFPYHEDVDKLDASASSCALCAVVKRGVQSWVDIFWEGVFPNHLIGRKLSVAKRESGAPGFLVLIDPINQPVDVVAAIGFFIEAGSIQSLNRAISWFKDCLETHESCPTNMTLLPTRVLDVSTPGDGIRLIDSVGMLGQYACLSYCWGSSKQFTTTRDTIKMRMSGFSESDLPRTILDAVIIVRHLAIKYLWVDSLCICQGDGEDWSRESARMTEIYSNAHIVIANNHGRDSSIGCFGTRPPRPMAEVRLPGFASNLVAMASYVPEEFWNDLGGFRNEALSQRGWALQERVLAKRLLHYNTRQMYFECNQGIIGEDGCMRKERYCRLDASIETWDVLVRFYRERNLTNLTDKFPAIGGLAKLFEEKLKAQYVAGLWSTHLISGLAWKPFIELPSICDVYIGPSWSWASYGPGLVNMGEVWNDITKVLEWNVEPKTQNNAYGEISSAWLRIRGPILNLIPVGFELFTNPPHATFRLHNDAEEQLVRFDSLPELESENRELLTSNLEVILLQEQANYVGQFHDPYTCFGLVVKKVGNERKRVGYMHLFERDQVASLIEDESNWKTVTLI
ncbi:hypothetical protein HYFRA_00010345 [Hymenoscyphus fraxineus]|uniref:Heterokaryon incompatibility domain-containing protein n=1 Tax=Hymenoscyphus fraxineus TaxID=746836 RepID=A0A9N9PUC5_9HELO|nr:hypothetical protein HYFRA_00010345 [Hymenoscyphus fraxineus]